MINAKIVIGLLYGDEGKGNTVQYLCKNSENPLVIRFGGGSQSSHTVYYEDKIHICTNYGAGVLLGVPTYWSQFTAVDPSSVLNELAILKDLRTLNYYNFDVKLITPYDILYNHKTNEKTKHGSTGTGLGTTIDRCEKGYSLTVRDWWYNTVFEEKLESIKAYYKALGIEVDGEILEEWKDNCDIVFLDNVLVNNIGEITTEFSDYIFEGNQGIMLDQEYGFFPHVTRAYTTSRNALHIINNELPSCLISTYYVVRSYATRHGNGPLPGISLEDCQVVLKNNEQEANVNGYQGPFRTASHDIHILNYALDADKKAFQVHNIRKHSITPHLVITCLDQTDEKVVMGYSLYTRDEFVEKLNTSFKSVIYSREHEL